MSSFKVNLIYNYLNTFVSVLFPLLTFPYAARILLPDGIGLVNFHNSVIGYITMITSLGIPLYAVREIARCRENVLLRNKTTIEISFLSIILALLGYIIVVLISIFVPQISSNKELFYILSLSIIFTSVGVDWFYQAIEEFKFITIRGILIRCLFVISLYIFVNDESDVLVYAGILVGSTVGNNIINFIFLTKHFSFDQSLFANFNIWKHLKPSLRIFVLNISISLYVSLNPILLGFFSDSSNVGYFTTGSRISQVILSVVLSMGTVLLPRSSNLIETKQTEQFNSLIQKAYHYYMAFALPLTLGLALLSTPITILLFGTAFYSSVPVVYITAPIIIFISMSNIIGMQILYPKGQEKLVIYSTIGGAIMNVITGFTLIPFLGAKGAAISMLLSEFAVLIVQLKLGKKYIPIKLFDKNIVIYLMGVIIMSSVILILYNVVEDMILKLVIPTFAGMLAYILYLYFKKDPITSEILIFLKIKKDEI